MNSFKLSSKVKQKYEFSFTKTRIGGKIVEEVEAPVAERSRSYKFPLRSCSRSMASKSALKLPLPKETAPLR